MLIIEFIKKNIIVLILVLLTIASETIHTLFVDVPFNNSVNLDSPIFFIISQFGELNFVPAVFIFLLIPKENRASKLIAWGLILWNLKELGDEINYLETKGISKSVLTLDSGFWGQITLISAVIFWGFYGFIKWRS